MHFLRSSSEIAFLLSLEVFAHKAAFTEHLSLCKPETEWYELRGLDLDGDFTYFDIFFATDRGSIMYQYDCIDLMLAKVQTNPRFKNMVTQWTCSIDPSPKSGYKRWRFAFAGHATSSVLTVTNYR